MKRGLVFSLCALAVASMASSAMAQATINLSLNLRYTDPADPTEGGTWQLVAKTNDTDGIAAIRALLLNAGTAATTTINTGIGALTNVGTPPGPALLDRTGGVLEIVYGQDMTAANTVLRVGDGDGSGPKAAAPAEIAVDPLRNTFWNGASLIASGAFGATRPSFTTFQTQSSDGNTLPSTVNGSTPAVDANVEGTTAGSQPTVRGDSLFSLGLNSPGTAGLRAGDANRDFTVTGADFAILQNNFNQAPGTKGWDQGDFNDDGNVSGADFALLQNNFGQPAVAPQVAAVPEPGTIALAMVSAGMAVVFGRRRRS